MWASGADKNSIEGWTEMKLVSFADNKRLYAVVAVGVALGVADKFGVQVPWLVSWLLKLLGQADLMAAIRAQSEKSAEDIVELVNDILAQVSLPSPPPLDQNADVTGAKVPPPVPVEVHNLDPMTPPDK